MSFDWGDGQYEYTASQLESAAKVVVDAASLKPGDRVIDLGCGTGNAALLAAETDASVTALDPAGRLLSVGKARAEFAGLRIKFAKGNAENLPFADANFDAATAVFSIIFASEPRRVASETLRVVKPGGRIVISSWVPTDGIQEAFGVLAEPFSPPDMSERPRWGEHDYLRELFASTNNSIHIFEHRIKFSAESAEVWWMHQEQKHPAVRFLRSMAVSQNIDWQSLRDQGLRILIDLNEDANAFTVTSRYLVTRVDLPA